MTRLEAICLHIAVALTTVSGAIFAYMKYAMTTDDPFAVANHPAQPFMLDAHVVTAPLLVFGFGLIFNGHIWWKYRSGFQGRRRSGLWSFSLIVPMVLSGYLLQATSGEGVRKAMMVTHWVSSAAFVIAYLVHQFVRRRAGNGTKGEDQRG
jgi:hypothetical protein